VTKSRTYPAILYGLFPAFAVFTDTDDDVETVVAGVHTLTMSLRAVTNKSEGVVLEIVLEFGEWPIAALIDDFLCASKVKSLDAPNSLNGT
jgi:hypothetical protein